MQPYVTLGPDPVGSTTTRAHEVLALLAQAPRSSETSWSRADLTRWRELTATIEPTEIRRSLALAMLCGAGPTDVVPAATHIVLAGLGASLRGAEAGLGGRLVTDVCDHLYDHVGPAVARQLTRPERERGELSSAVVWAYFFASLALLLFVVTLTR
jgi:hypothetical protein